MAITVAASSVLSSPNIDRTSGAWRTVDSIESCRQRLHKQPFLVTHNLATNPLFDVEQLVSVAQNAGKRWSDLHFDVGDASVDSRWGQLPKGELPATELIRRIETAKAWIIMKHVEAEPAYARVLNDFADFVHEIAGPDGAKLLGSPEMLVLVTSPHRVTPCHFDAEVNFLVQARGHKQVWVCDPNDRDITTEREIESYYGKSPNVPNFKPVAEERAWSFHLKAGEGVHIPTHGAHWVKNSDEVSVSLSLNFELPGWVHQDLYRCNYHMRRLGLAPNAPGRNALADRMKITLGSGYRAARVIKRLAKKAVKK